MVQAKIMAKGRGMWYTFRLLRPERRKEVVTLIRSEFSQGVGVETSMHAIYF